MRPTSLITVAIMALLGGCSSSKTPDITSTAPATPPTIDGALDDWSGALVTDDRKPYTLGVRNDGEYLYIAFTTSDRMMLAQIVAGGMTLWLDPTGRRKHTFGLRYPMGAQRDGAPPVMPPRSAEGVDVAALEAVFRSTTREMVLLDSKDDDGRLLPPDAVPGLSISATLEFGTFAYELAIPLRSGDAATYAVGAEPGVPVSVGFETPEIDMAAMREQMRARGGMGGGRPGGMGGGRPGGMGGGMPGGGMGSGMPGGMSPPEPLRLWRTVALAE